MKSVMCNFFASDLFKGLYYTLTMLLRQKIKKFSTMHGKLDEMVKQFRNRPGVAQKVPGGLGSQSS